MLAGHLLAQKSIAKDGQGRETVVHGDPLLIHGIYLGETS